jgi:hypothetical protein
MNAKHLTAAIALVLATPLSAATSYTSYTAPSYTTPSYTAPSRVPVPQVEHQSNVRFVSGGIGQEERSELQSLASDYNLKLIFATRDGHYLADVRTEVERMNGERVLDTTAQGPWLLADLEPGTYKVKVSLLDRNFEQVIDIPEAGRTQQLTFHFPWNEGRHENLAMIE